MTVATAERTGRRHAPKRKASRPKRSGAPGAPKGSSRPTRGRVSSAPAPARRRGLPIRRATRAPAEARTAGRGPRTGARPAAGRGRRATTQSRRARILLAAALSVSLLALVAWFPATALYHQHQQLGSTSAQLNELAQQDRALQAERLRLASPAEVGRIARQQYQLVLPGSRAFAVLPPNGRGSPDSPYAGDPGFQPPVAPSDAQLPAGSGPTADTPAASGHPAATPGAPSTTRLPAAQAPSLITRILQTLEFWR